MEYTGTIVNGAREIGSTVMKGMTKIVLRPGKPVLIASKRADCVVQIFCRILFQ